MDIIGLKKKFSSKENFVLYDWKDSRKDDFYLSDEMVFAYFFIRDSNPEKILNEIFINPMKRFQFRAGLEQKDKFSGDVINSNLKYLFASYEFPRAPEFNWTKTEIPIKRDTKLSSLKKESNLMKHLSKYIDN